MGVTWMDLRLAIRTLRKSPGFAFLVLLTLATGSGAATAIFSTVNAVVLRPLAFRDPDQLLMLWESNEERGWHQVNAAPANVLDWRQRVKAFADVAMVQETVNDVGLATRDGAAHLTVGRVSGNALALLGNQTILGRTFTFDETWAESEAGVVLSHESWRRLFASDSTIVNRTIRLDGIAHRVLGVMAPGFRYAINDAEAWTTFRWPAVRQAEVGFRRAHLVRAIARLRPGATAEQARAELSAVARELETEFPQTNRGMRAGLTPLHQFLVGDRRFPLLLLLGAVGLLQLIVCANVANLLLGRALARRSEMAVRTALGAGRGRIARQVLTESLLMATLGAVAGLGIAALGLELLGGLRPANLPDLAIQLDWRMLLFTLALTGGSALLFGMQPAWSSARIDISHHLRETTRTGTMGHTGFRVAHALVAVEIALAVVLVVGAGLMVRSLAKLAAVDSGVNPANVLTFEINPPRGLYPTDRDREEFAMRLAEQVRTLPGIRAVGIGRHLPFTGYGWSGDFTIDGWAVDRFGVEVRHREATAGYFRALEVPIVEGGLFTDPGPDERFPVVVNRAFAQRYFPDESAIGRRITFSRTASDSSVWHPIVGVVGNERMSLVSEPQPEIIAPLASDTPQLLRFVVKTSGSPGALAPLLRATAARLDGEVPIGNVRTMREVAVDALAADRFLMILMMIFATVAFVLAAIGVYGVTAQATRARLKEIGIRIALGASTRDIAAELMTRSMFFVGIGLVVGLAGAIGASGLLRKLLFRVQPNDPLTLVGGGILLTASALVAVLIPVWRASRLNPSEVLSTE